MRKLILLSLFSVAGIVANAQSAQEVYRDVRIERTRHEERAIVSTAQSSNTEKSINGHGYKQKSLKNLVAGIKLNSQRIGSAGNLLSVITGNCSQIDFVDSLNTVEFIHRNDPQAFPGANSTVSQYRFDVSKDRGNTWASDLGPINNSPIIDNINVNGRFPQAAIYNPAGNNNPDSADLIYSGTWHNDPGTNVGSWMGQLRGRGKLSGNASSFNVSIDTINGGMVDIATGFCQSKPGVFWNLNESVTGTFATNSNQIAHALDIQKGVWNPITKNVDWTVQILPVTFKTYVTSSSTTATLDASFDLAFDPSGQYGWISCLGNISASDPNDTVYHPIFWKSVDSGATWTGPVQLTLDSLPGVISRLYTTYDNGAATSMVPTTTFEAKLTVDYLGNPHLFTTVSNIYQSYSVAQGGGYTAYDITYNPAPPSCVANWNGWMAVYVDSVQTLRGTFTNDALTEDNRPLISRSPDGKKLFFFWLDSDRKYLDNLDANNAPNLFTRAFDLEHHSSTNPVNLTEGDSLWGGGTSNAQPGIFAPGASYPVVAFNALQTGTTYNVPLVLTQIDYNFSSSSGNLGSSNNPAAFWYANNLTYDKYDFKNSDAVQVQLNGSDTVIVYAGQGYVDQGATLIYGDTACYNTGQLHIVTDSTGLNTNVTGTYIVYYSAEDNSGNVYASVSTVVLVVAAPVADFSWSFPFYTYHANFVDLSTNNPTQWLWKFYANDTTGSSSKNPSHVFTADGNWKVCLTSSNQWGTSAQVCKQVAIVGVGIDEVALAQNIKLFPNPSNGKVNIAMEDNLSDFTITVYNMLGEAVVTPTKYKAGTSNAEMDLSSLSSGFYTVKIQTKTASAVKTLVLTTNK